MMIQLQHLIRYPDSAVLWNRKLIPLLYVGVDKTRRRVVLFLRKHIYRSYWWCRDSCLSTETEMFLCITEYVKEKTQI
jgi:hypothetical protein